MQEQPLLPPTEEDASGGVAGVGGGLIPHTAETQEARDDVDMDPTSKRSKFYVHEKEVHSGVPSYLVRNKDTGRLNWVDVRNPSDPSEELKRAIFFFEEEERLGLPHATVPPPVSTNDSVVVTEVPTPETFRRSKRVQDKSLIDLRLPVQESEDEDVRPTKRKRSTSIEPTAPKSKARRTSSSASILALQYSRDDKSGNFISHSLINGSHIFLQYSKNP
jgi:hypothetical protein